MKCHCKVGESPNMSLVEQAVLWSDERPRIYKLPLQMQRHELLLALREEALGVHGSCSMVSGT